MSDPSTQFDSIIEAAEKKTTNSFAKSRNNTVGSKDKPKNNKKNNNNSETDSESDYVPERPHVESTDKSKENATDENKSDSTIINELFPESGKAEDYRSHSVYLKDSHWKKIQKISKEQNISNSAVITRILDKLL